MLDIPSHLDNLDKLRKERPEHITYTYQKVFGMPEGELVLIDLMDRFFEFKPTMSDRESGAQAVLIYIKNTILGQVDTSKFEPKEMQDHASQS